MTYNTLCNSDETVCKNKDFIRDFIKCYAYIIISL